MKLLPSKKIIFHSALPPEELFHRLGQNICPKRYLEQNGSTYEKPFIGDLNEREFQMQRDINYSNSFLPVIIGKYAKHGSGSIIHVHFRLSRYVTAAIITFSVIILAGLGLLYFASILKSGFQGVIWMVIFIYTVFFFVFHQAFNYEVNRAKKLMREILIVESEESR